MTGGSPADDRRRLVLESIDDFRTKTRRGSAGWATLYHVTLFGSASLSAVAAAVLQIPSRPQTGLATALAALAAFLTTLAAVGRFQTKWEANRAAFYDLDALLLSGQTSDIETDALRDEFNDIRRAHRVGWTGNTSSSTEQPIPQGSGSDPAG